MNKQNIEANEKVIRSFSKVKSYSIDEILAAGGPDAFAEKLGMNSQTLFDGLKSLPSEAFLTEEEFQQAMETLNASK